VEGPAWDFLHISPREIGEYTISEIDLMLLVSIKRWKRDQTLADLRAARICSILTSSKDKPHPPDEFMIDYNSEKPKKEKRRQSPEEMAAILRGITMQHGGKIING